MEIAKSMTCLILMNLTFRSVFQTPARFTEWQTNQIAFTYFTAALNIFTPIYSCLSSQWILEINKYLNMLKQSKNDSRKIILLHTVP